MGQFALNKSRSEAAYEKRKLIQTRLCKYNLFNIFKFSYNLILTTKFNDSSNLITIISCNYLNLLLPDEHVGDVTIPTQVIEYNQNIFSRLISQSDWNIQIKLNYICIKLYVASMWTISLRRKCQEQLLVCEGCSKKQNCIKTRRFENSCFLHNLIKTDIPLASYYWYVVAWEIWWNLMNIMIW